jgi:hypothetical protein
MIQKRESEATLVGSNGISHQILKRRAISEAKAADQIKSCSL